MLKNIYLLVIIPIFSIIFIRTVLWHLQNWQIREYRLDRMLAYFKTKQGLKNVFNLWFFRGIFPRPKFSKRVLVIILLFLLFIHPYVSIFIFGVLQEIFIKLNLVTWEMKDVMPIFPRYYSPLHPILPKYFYLICLLLIERFIWFSITIAVFISKIPRYFAEKRLYQKAAKIMTQAKNVTVIGISGSYGKSSTKEVLSHLLVQNFGKDNVLKNPANENNEIAIARLILLNKDFFTSSSENKFFIVEIGAYKRGEIAKVCQFIQPNLGIITGLNSQHIELFGSQKNIQLAKFELAENVKNKIFFAADNELLQEIFADKKIGAVKIGISRRAAANIKIFHDKTEFSAFGENFVLPWPGEFFVTNALLALEIFRELGGGIKEASKFLSSLPPLQRALKISHFKQAILLTDIYSANPDGVLQAIKHLGQCSGQKIFVGIPLLELGQKSRTIHEKIFAALKEINAQVFWLKEDYSNLGTQICKKNFHGNDLNKLKNMLQNLKENDAILLESKLPKTVLDIFSEKN